MSSNNGLQKFEFKMEMTCEGCSGAAKRVLERVGVSDVQIDLAAQRIIAKSDKSSADLLEALKKTGKAVSFVGTIED